MVYWVLHQIINPQELDKEGLKLRKMKRINLASVFLLNIRSFHTYAGIYSYTLLKVKSDLKYI